MKTLRLSIDGQWTAADFAASLTALDQIYSTMAVLRLEEEAIHDTEMMYRELREFGPFPFHPKMMGRHLRRIMRAQIPAMIVPDVRLLKIDDLGHSFQILEPSERLAVTRLQFASPGFKDLAGLGEVIGHLKDFMIHLIDLYSNRRKRNLECDVMEAELNSKRAENAKQLIGIARELGYTKAEMRKLFLHIDKNQEALIQFVSTGRITDATIRESNNDKNG
ncbi:hypothetical protein HNR46_004279 [Haloferula luteola]|uniref:Uncharacterized protein n=1 Tax=Haloferula luteola TaxID=595692 RepID=A0A840V6X0_9BACT|nr:hypothetical protein [Haloferula luteola]MBB5354007.1 hypothetical protein [Haloferula luteola]